MSAEPISHGHDPTEEALSFLGLVWQPGEVREVRIPKHNQWNHTASGYFEDPVKMLAAVRPYAAKASIYWTLNPVVGALLARANNRIAAKAEHTTGDAHVAQRRLLLLDFDPVRPSGISATDAEVAEAWFVCQRVEASLRVDGWPDPAVIMSGNGWHLLYGLDLPNDETTTTRVASVLTSISKRFSTEAASIDTTVSNASRISALPGTLKMKGDSTPERPHRMVRIERLPAGLAPVTLDQLVAVAQEAPVEEPRAAAKVRRFDLLPAQRPPATVEERLIAASIAYRTQPPDARGVTWYHIDRCPFHEDGKPYECGVGQQLPNGQMAGKCFHPEGRGKGWGDFRDALGLGGPGRVGVRSSTAAGEGGLPVIQTSGRYMREIVDEAWDALRDGNDPPHLFQYGGQIAEVIRNDGEAPHVSVLDVVAMKARVDQQADFVRDRWKGDGVEPARPPKDVVETMVRYPTGLPYLKGIVAMPVACSDGSVNTTPGYQVRSALWYEASGEPVPPVPVRPSDENLGEARGWLEQEWLGQFPFAEAASKTNVIAAAMTAIARELYSGPSPMLVLDAPTPGTGKGYVAQSLGIIVMGEEPQVTTPPKDEDEWRKRITADLLRGTPVIQIDNVKLPLNSAALAGVLTATTWSDRRLGKTDMVRVPNRALWLATGNNIQLDGDIARRAMRARLDARMDRPWDRRGWNHDPFLPWVRAERHRLVWALLVLVRHWVAVGRPHWSGRPMGTFEDHNLVVGGILEAAGIEHFLANREELYRAADAEGDEWRAFTACWWGHLSDESVGVGDLLPVVLDNDLLGSVIRGDKDAGDRALKTRLGKALREKGDRRYGDLFIRSLGSDPRQKGQRYRLECAEPQEERTPGSAEVPQDKWSSAGSAAERAEPAEPVSGSHARDMADCFAGEVATATDKEVPHVPQVPHLDSVVDDKYAEPGAVTQVEVPQRFRAPCAPCDAHTGVVGCDGEYFREDQDGSIHCRACHPDEGDR